MPNDYTEAEYKQFARLVDKTGSRDQLKRIEGRFSMNAFVEQHGKEKCDLMFARLTKRDKKR